MSAPAVDSAIVVRARTPRSTRAHAGADGGAATPPIGIVFLLGGLGIGGAERQAVALAGALHRSGQRVHIVAVDDGPLREAVRETGVALHILGRPAGVAALAVPRLAALFRELAPDVVYAFLEVQWLLALAAARGRPGTRVVLGLRSSQYRRPAAATRARVVHELVTRLVRHGDLLVANSAAGLADFTRHCDEMPHGIVIPNGIDTHAHAPLPCAAAALRVTWGLRPDAIVVGHVGRLHPAKDHETLIDAFALAAGSDDRLQLVCVGDGPAERRLALQERAAQRGVASRVLFAGPRSDLAAVYSAFDLLALSSVREGFPNVVAEAMACGVPCVVTDTGASREIVGDAGEIVPVADREAFAAALTRLVARRSLALSAACRVRMLDVFTLEQCADRTLSEVRRLLLQHPTS